MERVETRNGVFQVTVEGEGPAVVLLHGWPETASSWRHQVAALAGAGYRVVAPNQRGYDGSFMPAEVAAYSIFHLAGDVVALLDVLGEETAAVVGHDWGALVAWHVALTRPDRVRGVAGLSVPYAPRAKLSVLDMLRVRGAEDYYLFHFQEPGVAERELERDVRQSLTRILYGTSASVPESEAFRGTVPAGSGLLDTMALPETLPDWLAADHLDGEIAAFERSGFRGPLNWYRNYDANWAFGAAWHGARITPPALFIAGARDPVLAAMRGRVDALAKTLADPRGVHVLADAGHWVQQEAPEAVNHLLLDFLQGI